jgi:hypothetical protein
VPRRALRVTSRRWIASGSETFRDTPGNRIDSIESDEDSAVADRILLRALAKFWFARRRSALQTSRPAYRGSPETLDMITGSARFSRSSPTGLDICGSGRATMRRRSTSEETMVGETGFEPATLCSQNPRSPYGASGTLGDNVMAVRVATLSAAPGCMCRDRDRDWLPALAIKVADGT